MAKNYLSAILEAASGNRITRDYLDIIEYDGASVATSDSQHKFYDFAAEQLAQNPKIGARKIGEAAKQAGIQPRRQNQEKIVRFLKSRREKITMTITFSCSPPNSKTWKFAVENEDGTTSISNLIAAGITQFEAEVGCAISKIGVS